MNPTYDDIIGMEYPRPSLHARMPMSERAKIFLPFAALKGYEEAIEEKQRVLVPRVALSQERKEQLEQTLRSFADASGKGRAESRLLHVTYFVRAADDGTGTYVTCTTDKIKLDDTLQTVLLNGRTILFTDIYEATAL